MNTQFQIQVEHLYVVDGMLERLPHNQTAVPIPQNRHTHQGALFVLAEVQGQLNNTDLIEKRLTILARDTFYNYTHGSITAALRHAMDTANRWLFQHNATHQPQKQVIAGLAIVALHNDDLFVAQAGPAAVYTNLDGLITRYPENSTWLQPVRNPLVGPSPALGLQQNIDPYITHLQVQSGDIIVLVDGRLGRSLLPEKAESILAGDDIKQISQKLVKNTQLQHGSAMVLQTLAPEKETAGEPSKPARRAASSKKGGFNFAIPAAAKNTVHTQQHSSSAAAVMSRPRAPFTLPKLPPMPQLPSVDIPVADIWHAIVDGVINGVTFLGNGLHTIFRLVLPGTSDSSTAGSTRRPSRSAMKKVAVILPILAIVVALATYIYQGYHRTQQFTETLTEANQKFATALTSPADQQRVLLQEAQVLAERAAAIKAEQPEVSELKEKIVTQQDTINNVKYLYYVPELIGYGETAQPRNVIQNGAELFVFDAAGAKIYHHTLDAISDTLLPNTTDTVIAQSGQQVGDVSVGDILGMTWVPAGGERVAGGLVIATRSGLFEYDPARNVLSAISIYSPDQWQNPVAFDSYYGNLYVLDTAANQIFRYFPAADGYPSPPDNYFADGVPVNLSGAVDMTIDGAIYVLYQDGHIAKFLSGEPQPFEINGLDIPLKNPVAIVSPTEDAPYLYVADAGNQRIVQLSKEGQFIAQFRPKTANGDIAFDNLHDMFVNPDNGKLYILNGTALLAPGLTDN